MEKKKQAILWKYFQQMYHSSCPTSQDTERGTRCVAQRVIADMNSSLSTTFTKEEVELALKQMAPLKSPGLDGFNPSLYQTY